MLSKPIHNLYYVAVSVILIHKKNMTNELYIIRYIWMSLVKGGQEAGGAIKHIPCQKYQLLMIGFLISGGGALAPP